MSSSLLRHPLTSVFATLAAIGGSTYTLRSHHIYNLEEHEARMDELEGTLRGHIGYIEDALDRLEGKKKKEGEKSHMDELYEKRGRDEKKGK